MLKVSVVRLREQHAILRTLRPSQRRLYQVKVQREAVGKPWRRLAVFAPKPLRFRIGLNELHGSLFTASKAQVAYSFGINREKANRRAVFGRHIGDGCAVGEREAGQPFAIKLDKLANHPFGAEHFDNPQHQIGRRCAFAQSAFNLKTDDLGNQHGDRLAEHRRFRLNTAYTPTEHRQGIDHGGVGVGADQGVGIGQRASALRLSPNGFSQIFEIDLVADTGTRRHHREVVKCALPPAQELVALAIALKLLLHIGIK